MIRHHKVLFLLSLLAVCVAHTACTKNEGGRSPCLEPRRYFLKIQTCTAADTGSAGIPVQLPSATIGYVDTPAGGMPDPFYTKTSGLSDFAGPLSSVADSTRWFIMPDSGNAADIDTLVFYYQRKPVFLSTACGYTMVYSLQNVAATKNVLDSVRIEQAEVTNATEVINVKVFY